MGPGREGGHRGIRTRLVTLSGGEVLDHEILNQMVELARTLPKVSDDVVLALVQQKFPNIDPNELRLALKAERLIARRKVVDDGEWKLLWSQPCPVCGDTLLNHATNTDVNELLALMDKVQGGEMPEIRAGPMKCLKCECFISRVALFQQIVTKARKRRSFKEPTRIDLPDDLFEPIVGFDDIKEILRRSLTSQRPVHQLLHGPPASAKTLFALELERVGAARYTLGSSSSKAGLRQMLMEDQPNVLIIDELDKGNRRDHSVLLSVMETGILVESLYGRHDGVRLETRVFATANDKTVLPTELLSRFGEGLCIRAYTAEEFLTVASRVLMMREGAPEDIAKVIAIATLQHLRSRDVRDAVRVFRLAQTVEEVPRIVEILHNRR